MRALFGPEHGIRGAFAILAASPDYDEAKARAAAVALGKASADMALDLLTQAKVVAVPGDAFGEAGEGFLRMCYAASEETLEKAVDRIRKYLAGR